MSSVSATQRGADPARPAQGPDPAGTDRRGGPIDRRRARERASIQEITEAADIGFGSFYNHFESKDQLFETASSEVLERWGRMIDRASAGITDPAEVFSISLRLSARLSWTHPEVARFITGAGLDLLDAPGGLAPAPCETSRPGKPRVSSAWLTPRSLSAPWRAASSGCCAYTSSIPNGSRRARSTSSPKPASASSASQPPRPDAWPGCRCPPPSLGDARPMSPPNATPRTRAEMLEAGRALRARVPRRAHGQWTASPDRPDPLEILSRSNANRLPELVPVRNGRMMASPFSYYRGSPAVMAADLSRTPSTGIQLQICGDAHLLNFGTFATPERNQVFDLNDFDETQPGPWEWDVKRLAASLVVAARTAATLRWRRQSGGARAVRRSTATRWRRWHSCPRSRCGTPAWTSSR